MKLKNVSEGTLVKIYNPSAMWVAYQTRYGHYCYYYDGEWQRGKIGDDERMIFQSEPNDNHNFIIAEYMGEAEYVRTTDEDVNDSEIPEIMGMFRVVNSNSYIATFENNNRYEKAVTTKMYIYSPSLNLDVELFDDSIKEKENFIFKMFPILSTKYPNLSDDEILEKAKELAVKMYTKSE